MDVSGARALKGFGVLGYRFVSDIGAEWLLISNAGANQPLNTLAATREQIWLAAQKIYANYPAFLEAAYRTLFGQ